MCRIRTANTFLSLLFDFGMAHGGFADTVHFYVAELMFSFLVFGSYILI
jgi:hypothetical protein